MKLHVPDMLIGRRSRSDAPAGATHVLSHVPSDFLEPPNGVGLWEMWTLRGYRRGRPSSADFDGLDAPAGLSEEDATAFAAAEVGSPVMLVRSSAELKLDGGEWVTEPIYYVIPAA